MPRCLHKDTIYKSPDNMSPIEPSCPTTAGLECSNKAEVQGKHLKTNVMKMIEVLKE